MYESPVHLILQDVQNQMDQEIEKTVITVVRKFGVDVNKGEIIKALKYDRNQYSKGYKDGVNDVLDKIRNEIEKLPTKTRTNWDGCCPDIDYPEIEYVDVTKDILLDIINKHKVESEV